MSDTPQLFGLQLRKPFKNGGREGLERFIGALEGFERSLDRLCTERNIKKDLERCWLYLRLLESAMDQIGACRTADHELSRLDNYMNHMDNNAVITLMQTLGELRFMVCKKVPKPE